MNGTLETKCFLCWRVINENNIENGNLENKTDKDKSCYKLNDNQIVNCKKYLQNEILNECNMQKKFSSSWDSQLFCFNCFEISESLTAVHEVFLEVQQQLKDIVELFNREILKTRLIKSNSTVDFDSKSSSGDNISETAELREKSQSKTETTDLHDHLNNKNDVHRKCIPMTLEENSLFLITSDTVDNLSEDFEIKEEPIIPNLCPLLKDCTDKNVSHSNNCRIGTESIDPIDGLDFECIKKSTLPFKKELVIKLTKLQFGPDGKFLMPSELSEPTALPGGRIKRKAAVKAVEEIKLIKSTTNTTKDAEYSDSDIESGNFLCSSEIESDDDNFDEESIDAKKSRRKTSTQSSKKKILHSSHACEKCGKTFQFKRSVLLHQMRFKECDVVERKRKSYFCKICNCTVPGNNKSRHIGFHTKPHSCHECGMSFQRTEALRRHMKEKHIIEFNFGCDRCNGQFKVIQDLNSHKRQHTKEDFMSNCDQGEHYQCNICEENFQKTDDLNLELFLTHMFSHQIYKCAHCNEKFDRKEFLKEHYSSEKHIDGFTCDLCSHVSVSIGAWKIHNHRHFNKRNSKIHVCELCGKSYKDKTNLKYHIIENHTTKAEKNFKCDQEGCDKAYITKRQLMGHVITTHKEKMCEVCGVYVKNMSTHMETHNKIPYECTVCGKKYKQKSNLQAHKKVSHEGHEVVCKICGQHCSSKANLRFHMLKHDDKRPFKCSECDKCFYRPDNLTTHMRSHTGEKPYKCDRCGKQFSRKDNLNTHVKKCPSNVYILS